LGENGSRTLFNIESHSGKSIRKHSFYPEEQEVLLPPARQFQVMGSLNQGNGLHIIHLKEIQPKYPLINLVQLPSTIPHNITANESSAEKQNIVTPTVVQTPSESIQPKMKVGEYPLEIKQSILISSQALLASTSSIIELYPSSPVQQPNTQSPIIPITIHSAPTVPVCDDSRLQKYIDALYLDPVTI
jgi:hypothetical protein